MKILRYRIRVVTLVLVSALLVLLLWSVRTAWLPSLPELLSPDAAAVPSDTVSPESTPSASAPADGSPPTPAPLYETFGL